MLILVAFCNKRILSYFPVGRYKVQRFRVGEFHGKRDYLLDMTDVTNVTLVGLGPKGGTLRMSKADYQKPPYTPSEWRYALSLLGARAVDGVGFASHGWRLAAMLAAA